ncbi:MAG TPA: F0F1 ATP synthase subunit beta, partial [Actinomycetota bacterium]|nr:F0F1 ATP synthase subunit beta [Actinomycetota bacterium]
MADTTTNASNGHAAGRVVRVIGPVVDVEFPPGQLPEINTAVRIDVLLDEQTTTITCEVAQHIGDSQVRTIALKPTDGMVRGSPVENSGSPISVPVGEGVLGRIFNVTGDPVDDQPAPKTEKRYTIHRPAPKLTDQDPSAQILETGIKVIDLICPFTKGG